MKRIPHNDYIFDFSNKEKVVVEKSEDNKIVCVYDYIQPVFDDSLPLMERSNLMKILNEVIRMRREWEWY